MRTAKRPQCECICSHGILEAKRMTHQTLRVSGQMQLGAPSTEKSWRLFASLLTLSVIWLAGTARLQTSPEKRTRLNAVSL